MSELVLTAYSALPDGKKIEMILWQIFGLGTELFAFSEVAFIADWKPTSNFLCMCSIGMARAHVILKYVNQTKIKGGCQLGR